MDTIGLFIGGLLLIPASLVVLYLVIHALHKTFLEE